MNEKDFSRKVARALQAGLSNIDDATCAKLKSARRAALEHFVEAAPERSFAWAGAFNGKIGNIFSERPLIWAPLIAALLALAIGGYFQYGQTDTDDVDAFLLSGDLPVRAYIDQDFD